MEHGHFPKKIDGVASFTPAEVGGVPSMAPQALAPQAPLPVPAVHSPAPAPPTTDHVVAGAEPGEEEAPAFDLSGIKHTVQFSPATSTVAISPTAHITP